MNSHFKITELDKQILWHLDYDARVPFTALADMLGISKQGLNARLNNLIENQVLTGYYAVIDTHRLGLLTYRVYLRLHSTKPRAVEKLIKVLSDHQLTLFVGTLSGSWDLEVVFTARNYIHFNELLKELAVPLSEHVYRSNISMTPVVYGLRRDYLLTEVRKTPLRQSYGFEPGLYEWDELDFKLLGFGPLVIQRLVKRQQARDEALSLDRLELAFNVANQLRQVSRVVKRKVVGARREPIARCNPAILDSLRGFASNCGLLFL